MPELQEFPLATQSGLKGRVYRASRFLDRSATNRVKLENGTEVTVPSSELRVQPDGTFFWDDGAYYWDDAEARPPAETVQAAAAKALEHEDPHDKTLIIPRGEAPRHAPPPPPPAEEPAPERLVARESAVAPQAKPDQHAVLDEPLIMEDVQVERVPVNRIVDAAPEIRHEGDVMIVPVIEEVITVQKRILLKEEVRITRSRKELREERRVVVGRGQTRIIGADGRQIEE